MYSKPWQEWCNNWNRYTRRRFDAGVPIVQRFLKEREITARLNTSSGSVLVSALEGADGRITDPLIIAATSKDYEAGSIERLAAETPKRAGATRASNAPARQIPKVDSFFGRVRGFIRRTFRRGGDRGRG